MAIRKRPLRGIPRDPTATDRTDRALRAFLFSDWFTGDLHKDNMGQLTGWTDAPATLSSPGIAGQKAFDSNYFYIAIATDTWRRVPISTVAGMLEILTGTFAARPAPSREGDLYLPNDGFYVYRDTGAAWAAWGPIFPLTVPISDDFAWINQGTATLTTTFDGIFLAGPAGVTDNIRIRKKAAPATPYTITALVMPLLYPADFASCGLLFRESGSGKLVTAAIGFDFSIATNVIQATKFNSPTSFSAHYVNIPDIPQVRFLRIADNGVSRISSYSADGQNFRVFHSIGRTDFLTANEVGFFVNTVNGQPPGLTLLSWKETA